MTVAIQAIVDGLSIAAIYALVALGLTFVFGLLDIVNFANGQFLLLGGYLTYQFASWHVNYWLAVLLAVVAVGVLGAATERIVFRPVRDVPINGLLISIGLIAVMANVDHVIWGPNAYTIQAPVNGVLHVGSVSFAENRLVVIVVTIMVVAGLAVFLRSTKAGTGLRATAQNAEAAALMGIPVERVRNASFLLGTALAGLAGGLVGSVFPVEPVLGTNYLIEGFIVVIIGGAGSPVGAVLAAVLLGVCQSLGVALFSTGASEITSFVLLILILFVRPQGLITVSGARGL
jgi:branched-chain amino acid transport system permease protein